MPVIEGFEAIRLCDADEGSAPPGVAACHKLHSRLRSSKSAEISLVSRQAE